MDGQVGRVLAAHVLGESLGGFFSSFEIGY